MNYTKCKWKFKRPYDADGNFSSIETEDERIICLLPEPHFIPDCGDTTWYNGNVEVLKYNARLISAAPNMYEALKAWDNYATKNYPENMKLKRIAWELTEKALAKAEGK
jgi:hypothetical protein